VTLAGAPAAGQPIRLIRVVLEEYRITPAAITVKSGERIRLEVQNGGTVTHEFRSAIFRGIEVTVRTQGFDVLTERFEVLSVRPTWIATLEFTRRTPGEYQFWCGAITPDGKRHIDLGMVGKFVVVP
jgi:uncharacterized cupredoxin-like copper-binding protein